jgi:hypothetical protein
MSRTPLRKLLKRRQRGMVGQSWWDRIRREHNIPTGVCTCDHPRVRHVKPPRVRRYYKCTVKGCDCYIAANVLRKRKAHNRVPRRKRYD